MRHSLSLRTCICLCTVLLISLTTATQSNKINAEIEKPYTVKVSKRDLMVGVNPFPMVPEGMSQDQRKSRLESSHTDKTIRHPLLGSIDQTIYFPVINVVVSERMGSKFITDIRVDFEFSRGVANFVVPPFTLNVVSASHKKHPFTLTSQTNYRVPVNASGAQLPLKQVEFELLEDPSVFPELLTFTVTPKEMFISSYEYDLKDGISEALFSGDLYDLKPGNATMMTKFLARYDVDKDALGVWVTRRSPIPDFTLVIGVDNLATATHSATTAPPGGLGLAEAFVNLREGDNAKLPYHLVLHYYEAACDFESTTIFTDNAGLKDAITTLSEEDDSLIGFQDQSTYTFPSSEGRVKYTLKYLEDTKHVGLLFQFDRPMEQALLSVHDEKGFTLFREIERLIPYTTKEEPFGWYFVLGCFLEDGTATTLALDRIHKITLRIQTRTSLHPASLMSQWITENGGDVDGVTLAEGARAAFEGQKKSQEVLRQRGLTATRDFSQGEVVAAIPYRLLLTEKLAQHNEWCAILLANGTDEYATAAKVHGFQPEGVHFMILAFFAIAQPSHPTEGVNWRLYFDTFPAEHPAIPAFYTGEEMTVFDFSPSIKRDAAKMRAMWSAEYSIITKHVPWVAKHKSEEVYAALRAQVESRIINASGNLVMLPLMDWMHHDDSPSVTIAVQDKAQKMAFVAQSSGIKHRQQVTCDYGTKSLAKRDFLVQFGFIPTGAHDTVDIFFEGSEYILAKNKQSAQALRDSINEYLDSGVSSEQKVTEKLTELLKARVKQIPSDAELKGKIAPHRPGQDEEVGVRHMLASRNVELGQIAVRLAKSEREVLAWHLQYHPAR